jgi:hypothetical protein
MTKKKYVYQVWCEWDIGQEYGVFSTEAKAREWVESNESLKEVFEDGGEFSTAQDVEDAGLIGYKKLELD